MKETQEKKKNKGLNILIVLLLTITIVASSIGLYAWAKYTSSESGEATAQVAKWYFDLKGNGTDETDTIDFGATKYDHVANNKIAPGTSGQIDMVIDTTGTEVSLVYDVVVSLTDCPKNLLFYKDKEYQNELPKVNEGGKDKLYIKEYVPINKENVGTEVSNGKHNETIYWRWKYETGTRSWEKENNDAQDVKDQGKNITMQIVATGTEVMEEPTYTLEELVRTAKIKIGDEVDYNALKENGVALANTNDTTYIAATDKTGAEQDQTFTVESNMKWKVLSRDADKGTIEIISADGTTTQLTLKGGTGFINSKEVLDEICGIYDSGDGAVEGSGRSLDIGDIEKYSSYEPKDYNTKYNVHCGETKTYNSGTFYKEKIDPETGEVIGYENRAETASGDHQVTMHETDYKPQDAEEEQKSFENKKAYEVLFQKSDGSFKNCRVASRCVTLLANNCSFCLRSVGNGRLGAKWVYTSSGSNDVGIASICPVLSLKSDIQMEKNANGEWKITDLEN